MMETCGGIGAAYPRISGPTDTGFHHCVFSWRVRVDGFGVGSAVVEIDVLSDVPFCVLCSVWNVERPSHASLADFGHQDLSRILA